MRVTLLHNPRAGSETHSRSYLLGLLRGEGYDVTYQSTSDDLDSVLKDPGDFIVAAGGDGTIRKVALALIGRGVPIAILPLGTANNISKSFGIVGSPEEVVAGWRSARCKQLLVGLARGSSRQEHFIEGVGLGLLSHSMARLADLDEVAEAQFSEPAQRVKQDVRTLKAWLHDLPPIDLKCTIDNNDLSGLYLLMEAMNINCVGPNLCLAPGAREPDVIEFVFLEAGNRERFDKYLTDLLAGTFSHAPVKVIRGKQIVFRWDGSPLHIDDTIWKNVERAPEAVEIRQTSDRLQFMVPT